MSALATPIPARHKNVNRAEVCDQNFVEHVQAWRGQVQVRPAPDQAVLPGSLCTAADFEKIFAGAL